MSTQMQPKIPATQIVANVRDPFAGIQRVRLNTLEVAEVTITPALATSWLNLNQNFRALSESRAGGLGEQMKERWDLNGETIKFGKRDGKWVLVDGQHRLRGCVVSGRKFRSLVVWGVSSDLAIDIGAVRKLADLFHSQGEKNYNALAAAVKWMWKFENDKMRATGEGARVSHFELLDVLARHPDIRHSTTVAHAVREILPYSVAAFFHYIFSRRSLAESNQFFEALGTGANLERDDPVFLLRRRLLKDKDATKLKLRTIEKIALVTKAWNYWIAGRSINSAHLRWRGVGPQAEAFPEVEGLNV
jgi:hypothetical protein